jgi:hypothetical protein
VSSGYLIRENDAVGMNTNQTVGHREPPETNDAFQRHIEPPGTLDAFRQQAVF